MKVSEFTTASSNRYSPETNVPSDTIHTRRWLATGVRHGADTGEHFSRLPSRLAALALGMNMPPRQLWRVWRKMVKVEHISTKMDVIASIAYSPKRGAIFAEQYLLSS